MPRDARDYIQSRSSIYDMEQNFVWSKVIDLLIMNQLLGFQTIWICMQ